LKLAAYRCSISSDGIALALLPAWLGLAILEISIAVRVIAILVIAGGVIAGGVIATRVIARRIIACWVVACWVVACWVVACWVIAGWLVGIGPVVTSVLIVRIAVVVYYRSSRCQCCKSKKKFIFL